MASEPSLTGEGLPLPGLGIANDWCRTVLFIRKLTSPESHSTPPPVSRPSHLRASARQPGTAMPQSLCNYLNQPILSVSPLPFCEILSQAFPVPSTSRPTLAWSRMAQHGLRPLPPSVGVVWPPLGEVPNCLFTSGRTSSVASPYLNNKICLRGN